MFEIKVEVTGKNSNCSADSTVTINHIQTPKELFARDLGEVIFCAECAGHMITTDEVYRDAMNAFDTGFMVGRTYRCLLSKLYDGTSVKISIKLVN